MRQIRLVIGIFLMASPLFAGAQLTLKQCIETGIANNQAVLQADLQTESAAANLKQARAERLPDLNGLAGHGINQGRSIDPFTNTFINQQVNYASYSLSSGMTIFSGFAVNNRIKENQLIFQAAKMQTQQAKDNLAINIILAYLQVLNNEDLLEQGRQQFQFTNKQVDRLVILDKDGAIPPSQLYDLKGQAANDELAIIAGQNAVETAKINLCQLMNIPYNKDMRLERTGAAELVSKYENTADAIYQAALDKFALVKVAELRRLSSASAVKTARSGLFPTLTLNGNVNSNYSSVARLDVFSGTSDVVSDDYVLINGNPSPVIRKQDKFNSTRIAYGSQLNNNLFTSFSLNLRVPIFNAWQVRTRVNLAKITLKSDELAEKTTRIQLRQAIDQAYINMSTAGERYKKLLEQVAAYRVSFRAAEVRFESGVGSPIDYLTAKNNLDRSNNNLINAGYDFMFRVKVLDYYEGKPY
jgi:outer membrane protein